MWVNPSREPSTSCPIDFYRCLANGLLQHVKRGITAGPIRRSGRRAEPKGDSRGCFVPLYIRGEFFWKQHHVYPASGTGNVSPIQTISGSDTGLNLPAGLSVDANRNIYGGNSEANSVTVYPASATGDVSPIQSISGSNTGLFQPDGVTVDTAENVYASAPPTESLFVYAAGSNGNVAPIRTISGPKTQLANPVGVAVDASGTIYVVNEELNGFGITVYPSGSNGNVAPSRIIAGSRTELYEPDGIAADSKGNIFVTDASADSINVFSASAHGNVRPSRRIVGSKTGLAVPHGIAVDASGKIYVTGDFYPAGYVSAILVFGAKATGNVAPIQTIYGSSTGLSGPWGIAVF